MKVKSESEVAQSCLTLSDPMDCSLPGSSIMDMGFSRQEYWSGVPLPSPLEYPTWVQIPVLPLKNYGTLTNDFISLYLNFPHLQNGFENKQCPADMVFVRIKLVDTYKALKVGWPVELLAATVCLPILSRSIYILHGVCDMYFDFLRSCSLFPVISKVQKGSGCWIVNPVWEEIAESQECISDDVEG